MTLFNFNFETRYQHKSEVIHDKDVTKFYRRSFPTLERHTVYERSEKSKVSLNKYRVQLSCFLLATQRSSWSLEIHFCVSILTSKTKGNKPMHEKKVGHPPPPLAALHRGVQVRLMQCGRKRIDNTHKTSASLQRDL